MVNEMSLLKSIFEGMKIKEIMTTPVVTVKEDDELSLAQMKFVNNHINHLVVVNSDNQVVGLLSHKYLYRTQSPRKVVSEEMDYDPDILMEGGDSFYSKETLDRFILRTIMNKEPITLGPQDSVARAISIMASRHLSCIPVVDQTRRPIGVLTNQEIVTYLAKNF